MNTCTPAAPLQRLESGRILVESGQRATVWRVLSGVLRLERPSPDGQMLIQLALPGDLVGVEALCAQPHAYSATALTDCRVEAVEITGELSHYATMAKGFLQQQRQALDMIRLRSGPIQQRLAYLLTVLGKDIDGRARPVLREELPTLREMAQIVDSALETVCRELNSLLPRKAKINTKTMVRASTRNRSRWVKPAAVPAMAMAA